MCETLVDEMQQSKVAVGETMVLYRDDAHHEMERMRQGLAKKLIVKIQALVRGWLCRKRLKVNRSATKIQAMVRGYLCRKETEPLFRAKKALDEAVAGRDISKLIRAINAVKKQRLPAHVYEEAQILLKQLNMERAITERLEALLNCIPGTENIQTLQEAINAASEAECCPDLVGEAESRIEYQRCRQEIQQAIKGGEPGALESAMARAKEKSIGEGDPDIILLRLKQCENSLKAAILEAAETEDGAILEVFFF